jgi:uncharacterized membrane protein YhaH (DUF805 family)
LNSAQLIREDRPSAVVTRADPLADGLLVDLTCVVLAFLSLAFIVSDADTWLRAPLVLVFALFVPGWTILRAFGMPGSLFAYVGAVGISISLIIVLGESLVLFGDWKWFPVGVVLTGGTCAIGAVSALRRFWAPSFNVWRMPRVADQVVSYVPLFSVASVIIGNSLVAAGIRRTQRQDFGLLGLIDVLSPVFWIGVAVLIGGLAIVCYRGSRWAWLNVAALVAALHGLPGLLEPNPRFSVAWIHTGFIKHIASEGTLLRSLDARFSWAGFFAGGGLLQQWTGTDSMLWVVRYAPLFFNGLAVVLVGLLARRLRATEMQSVIAAALFCCLNWIGQDYFAPQATAFLLYLMIITVVLYAFPADPSRGNRWLTRVTRPAMDAQRGLRGRQATLVLFGCYALVVTVVMSHQLTPGFLLSATLLLVAVNATRLRALPVFIGVVFLAWLSFGAKAYWFGHFDALTGSVGKVGDLVNQNVGNRTASQAFGRRVVVASRIGLALFAWGGAAISLFVHWLRRSTPVALACLLVAPFPMLLLQPYGGEMALRVCYFSLPPACILIAQLLVPARRVRLSRWIALGVAMFALVPAFITARFGNESFEAFSNNDVALARALYEQVPDNSTIFVASQQTIKYEQRVAEVRFRALPGENAADVTDLLLKYPRDIHVFIELTESQQAYGIVSLDRRKEWMKNLRSELLATNRYRVVAEIGDGVLLELVRQ